MATTILKNIKEAKGRPSQHLYNSVKYILNPAKTMGGIWQQSNCGTDASEIYEAMMTTKKDFGKEWGRQGYHFVISFAPGEADEETCFKVAKEFCEQYMGDNYEYAFAVHNDQPHMHCHIVFNSVNRLDGSKYRYVNGDWEKHIQPLTDKIAVKYGLSRLEYDRNAKRKGKSYVEHVAEKEGRFTWKRIIRLDIDMAVSNSNSLQEYFAEMKRMGYDMRIGHSEKHGEYISYRHPAMKIDGKTSKKARRDYNLGSGYTYTEIKERIKNKNRQLIPPAPVPVCENELHTICEHRNSRFQVCAVMRYTQARQYLYYNLQLKDQIRVREDLLHIDRLRDECNYLLDNNITDVKGAEDKLEEIKKEIQKLKKSSSDKKFEETCYNEDENRVRNEYFLIYGKLTDGSELSDEEYERLSEQLEEMEKKYPEILSRPEVRDFNYQDRINALYKEKRLLSGIIKEAGVTLSVTEYPQYTKRQEQERSVDEDEELFIPEQVKDRKI